MKGLSLWQPWASFVALGFKGNETRSWETKYRGLLAIHAAKNKSALDDADDILEDAGFDMSERTTIGGTKWPLGEYVALGELVDCVRVEAIRDTLTRRERAMGNYSDGRFAWIMRNIRKLSPRVDGRGAQGLFDVDGHALIEIRKQFPDVPLVAVRMERDLFR